LRTLSYYFVESGVDFTNDFGDIDENFYSGFEKMYVQALILMRKENLLDNFSDRAKKVMENTNDIDWGFGDYISDVYYDFYQEDIDEGNENN